jgi:protein O-GlcNAc transferase
MFEVWLRLLAETPAAVLWLLRASPGVEGALRRAAEAANIDSSRLIFADKLPRKAHLARLACADLMLDTRLYNGHTTTTDALLAGVPVVALEGRHFASRVSASILRAHGMEQLIADSLDTFHARALELARDGDRRTALRASLASARGTAPLFDPKRVAGGLERLYRSMWDRAAAGEPPAPIGPGA